MKNAISFLFIVALMLVTACGGGNSDIQTATGNKPDSLQQHLKSITLKVGGMTCGGCESSIESGLLDIEGVTDAQASHTDSLTTVKFDSTLVEIAQIKETITGIGYHVSDSLIN